MKKSNRFYSFTLDESTLSEKLTPQILQIFSVILKSGNSEFAEADLKKLVESAKKDGVLKTRQSSWRIFSYYRANMISDGFLTMKSEEITPKVEESQVVNA
tara:strand:+ start:740 stop:1042 length:303 start_codon:yes stop_codon:yes gene_type:complete